MEKETQVLHGNQKICNNCKTMVVISSSLQPHSHLHMQRNVQVRVLLSSPEVSQAFAQRTRQLTAPRAAGWLPSAGFFFFFVDAGEPKGAARTFSL